MVSLFYGGGLWSWWTLFVELDMYEFFWEGENKFQFLIFFSLFLLLIPLFGVLASLRILAHFYRNDFIFILSSPLA